ncbi:MAG: class II fructose-bisphosphate aldolase [Pirellulaceae bacterium]
MNLTGVLEHARANRYAVPAFDCVEDVMVRAILERAEELRAPVILMGLASDLAGNGMLYLPALVRAVADHHGIPVALQLDHATELDLVRHAIDRGFTSVMVDGSSLPFSDNVALTKAAVDMARPHHITVEGELGYVGGRDLDDAACGESVLTDPADVARFVDETGVDALAVSIGTSHGVYRGLPTLSIDRLKELHAASSVPLVLHGGSGTPADQIREAVNHGITKMNVYADCRIAMGRGLQSAAKAMPRTDPLPKDVFGPIKAELVQVVGEKMELLSTVGKAW